MKHEDYENAYADDESIFELSPTFEGICTCKHHRWEHGWGRCDVEGCDCQAGWEE